MINSNIITIGDEILSGHIIDTNAKWLSERLNNLGVTISKRLTIPDKKKDIKKTIKLSINESDIIIVTGGLGPTNDDITKKTLCEIFNSNLKEDKKSLNNVLRIFNKRGLKITKKNTTQTTNTKNINKPPPAHYPPPPGRGGGGAAPVHN